MRTLLIFGLALFLVWVICSGFIAPFFLLSGAVSSMAVLLLMWRMGFLVERSPPLHLRPTHWPYLLWLCVEIIKSALDVTRRIWQLRPEIAPALAWVTAGQRTESGLTLYANSITLTPGTVCVDAREDRLRIHALTLEALEGLKEGTMRRKVRAVTSPSSP